MRYNEAAAEVKALLDQIDWSLVKRFDGTLAYQPQRPTRTSVDPVTRTDHAGGDGCLISLNIDEFVSVTDKNVDDPFLPLPSIYLLSFGYTVTGRLDTASEVQTTRNPGPTQNRESDWIAVSRFGGEEINTMDGFTGLSRQIIRVSLFSLDRERSSLMADEVVKKINNFVGETPNGLDFQCCLLDEVFDNNDEESSINGMDMFFVVVVSG